MKRRECLKMLLAVVASTGLPRAVQGSPDSGINRIRDLRRNTWLSSAELLIRLVESPALVIGETHDNPEHHRLERWLIAQLAARQALGGVAMEMLDSEQQTLLEQLAENAQQTMSDAQWQKALKWQRGWEWSAYGPTLQLALSLDVPVRGANLTASEIREIVKLDLAPELPLVVARSQRQALMEGHCGMLPESMLDGMLAAQVARDQAMAAALAGLPPTSVLVCGNGHARRDVGVALHAKQTPLCLGLVEVPPGQTWRSALPTSVDAEPPFDLAWFTMMVANREDPCIALRERFAQ
ncbi:ChaN family lipoprotein [Halomonas sp. PR-M31]|uniref:ChaN family lipoprotein n=1 Tax=Halomonas sp. PR-M31 TaxID=1471202 RepID=UPI000651D4BC|nr:ChaN family lipoprotein [Halomonas sp. PR-M31]